MVKHFAQNIKKHLYEKLIMLAIVLMVSSCSSLCEKPESVANKYVNALFAKDYGVLKTLSYNAVNTKQQNYNLAKLILEAEMLKDKRGRYSNFQVLGSKCSNTKKEKQLIVAVYFSNNTKVEMEVSLKKKNLSWRIIEIQFTE